MTRGNMQGEENEVFTTWTSDLEEKDICVMCLVGELDVSTAPILLNDIRGVIALRKHLILDVHLLSYIDSTGLSTLLSAQTAKQELGGSVCLVGCHGLVTKILAITRIEQRIKCFADVDTAVAELNKGCW
jgi:anti-sigma B factor antagonist